MQDPDYENDFHLSKTCAADPSPVSGSGIDAGFVPLTANYLLERGYCCGNGCKHSPYNYEAVPEPKRSYLLADKKNGDTNQ